MRISTNKDSQKHDRQEKAIRDYAKANHFTVYEWHNDIISGKVNTDSRPNYQYMKNKLKAGDVLIVSDLDRLGRDTSNTIVEIKELQAKGIKLIALDIPYLNEWGKMNDDSLSKMIIDIVVTLKAHIAEQEREKTVSRINQGLAVAKEKDVKLGRPPANLSADFAKQYEKFLNGEYGEISATGFAKILGIGRSTLYKYIGLYNENKG
jgi:DNA invertase Pin-like site-specific DNA recombinase